jgi:hypothetical protein
LRGVACGCLACCDGASQPVAVGGAAAAAPHPTLGRQGPTSLPRSVLSPPQTNFGVDQAQSAAQPGGNHLSFRPFRLMRITPIPSSSLPCPPGAFTPCRDKRSLNHAYGQSGGRPRSLRRPRLARLSRSRESLCYRLRIPDQQLELDGIRRLVLLISVVSFSTFSKTDSSRKSPLPWI